MFGRGGGPIPRGTRFVVGAIASLVGAFVLWLAIRISRGEAEGATDDPTVAYFFAAAMLGMGLTVFIGAIAGVGDKGERPETMSLPMRILLDALGYVFGFAFAAMMAFWALTPEAPLIVRIGFGLFALLVGGASAYALIDAVVKSTRKR
jgi:hypothetical protein